MRFKYWLTIIIVFNGIIISPIIYDKYLVPMLTLWVIIIRPLIDYIFIKKRNLPYKGKMLIYSYPFWCFHHKLMFESSKE